jgi:hypothetical protein
LVQRGEPGFHHDSMMADTSPCVATHEHTSVSTGCRSSVRLDACE